MSRNNPSTLMFDEDEIRSVTDPALPRLLRIIFYANSITNEIFNERYRRYLQTVYPEMDQKEFGQRITSLRKALFEARKKMTFNMFRGVLLALGYEIAGIDIRVRFKLTGEIQTFSTDDNLDTIKAKMMADRDVGVSSID